MTRSSIVAAVVVTLLLGLLIWWRDEHSRVDRASQALTPSSSAVSRVTGEAMVVPATRRVAPSIGPSIVPYESTPDAGVPASR
jgi:hypothetical protein